MCVVLGTACCVCLVSTHDLVNARREETGAACKYTARTPFARWCMHAVSSVRVRPQLPLAGASGGGRRALEKYGGRGVVIYARARVFWGSARESAGGGGGGSREGGGRREGATRERGCGWCQGTEESVKC